MDMIREVCPFCKRFLYGNDVCECPDELKMRIEFLEKENKILFAEIKKDCDSCHVRKECEHEDCSALRKFYKKLTIQELELEKS